MTLVLDEGVPRNLAFRLHGHTVETVGSQGWCGVKNGSLLKLIEQSGFDVFVTADKNLSHQQPVERYSFAVLVLSTNHWPTMKRNAQAVRDALNTVVSGSIVFVDCGVFVPAKQRRSQ